jgi:hypothetical protein
MLRTGGLSTETVRQTSDFSIGGATEDEVMREVVSPGKNTFQMVVKNDNNRGGTRQRAKSGIEGV